MFIRLQLSESPGELGWEMVIYCVFAEEATPGPHSDLVKWKENESPTAGENIHPAELPAGVGSRPMGPSEHFMDSHPYSAHNSSCRQRPRYPTAVAVWDTSA